MFKKIAMVLALTFSLTALASAQVPLPGPPGGGGNIVSK
jgi:hypothetical protein